MTFRAWTTGACGAVALLIAASAQAGPLVPTSLSPGDPYHLVFVTSTGRDATSSSIADYNAFVNLQAANNPTLTGTNVGVNYFAIASTMTVDAINNAPVTAPVYNLQSELIALNSGDLWDGTLANPINYDEFASQLFPPDVWTGTDTLGAALTPLGGGSPNSGRSDLANSMWINDSVSGTVTPMSFYALSEVLFAPATTNVPEPSSLLLWFVALVSLLLARNRFRRN